MKRLISLTALLVLAALPLLAGGCRLLGVAELTPLDPQAEPSSLTLRIFEGDPGDSWPREGEVLFWLSGTQVPIESLGLDSRWAWSLSLKGQDRGCGPEGLHYQRGDMSVELWGSSGGVPWTAEDASDGRVDINLFAVGLKVFFATKSYWFLEVGIPPMVGRNEPIYCGQANWVS